MGKSEQATSNVDASENATPLFRAEALDARRPQTIGRIMLVPGSGSRRLAIASLLLIAAIVAFGILGTYTRRSTVVGQLMPREGLIRVNVEFAGVVIEARARDGDEVKAGQVLLVVSGDRVGADAKGFQRDMASQIAARRDSLDADRQRIALTEAQEIDQIGRRLASLAAEKDRAYRQTAQFDLQVNVALDAMQRYQGLLDKGFVSRDELGAKELSLAGLRAQREGAHREALALQREAASAQRDLDTVRSRYALQRGELDRARLVATQEFTELEARRRVVVTAPRDGRITLMRADIGQSVEPQRPVLHIVPTGDLLTARLMVPSRAAGFIKPGMPVLLRYDAFPYQKFGQQRGTVKSVSAAAAFGDNSAASLQPQGAGPEPMFEVAVELPEQVMRSDPALRLQPGMRVEAQLLHESRPLFAWMLEPLIVARSGTGDGL